MPPTAIVSYSHDDDEHRARVLQLVQELRAHGIDCILDRFVDPTDWALWMETELRKRDWVLVVATDIYQTRARGEEKPGRGLGASWEYGVIRQTLYEARGGDPKFVPIVFGRHNVKYIPEALRGRTYYDVSDAATRTTLFDKLAGRSNTVVPAPLGSLTNLNVVSNGTQSFPAALQINSPRRQPTGETSIRPRLYLNVQVVTPGFMAVGNGPVHKIGTYKLRFELWNKGKGAANKVRVAMGGMSHVQRLGTVAPRDKPLKFTWELETERAYHEPPDEPAVVVEYLDDDGIVYRQRGPLQIKNLSGAFGYEGGNLESPEPVAECLITY
jgi:hypothetical protein